RGESNATLNEAEIAQSFVRTTFKLRSPVARLDTSTANKSPAGLKERGLPGAATAACSLLVPVFQTRRGFFGAGWPSPGLQGRISGLAATREPSSLSAVFGVKIV